MTQADFSALVTLLHSFYGEQFPSLLPEMAKFWFESVRYVDEDIASLALHRWVRQHALKPPSLDEWLEQIDYIQDEERRTKRNGSSRKGYAEVLKDAAEAQAQNPERSDDEVTYGRLMAALATRSIEPWFDSKGQQHPKLTMEQRGQQCCLWARKYEAQRPQLAADLRHAAVHHFGVPMSLVTGIYANDAGKDEPHA